MRFDLNLENERREADEFRNLFKDISIIIDSFKLISSTSPWKYIKICEAKIYEI